MDSGILPLKRMFRIVKNSPGGMGKMRLDLRALLLIGLVLFGVFYFGASKADYTWKDDINADGKADVEGQAGLEIYVITKDGKEIRLDSEAMTILYNGQPISAIVFKPWIKVTTNPSTSGTYTYTYTRTVYVNGQKVSSSSGSGSGTLGSKKYLTIVQVIDATMERYIPAGQSGTVKVVVTVTVTWIAPNGQELKKSITFTGSARVMHKQDPQYQLLVTGGVDKVVKPGIL